ncbi:MAG TPA: topoisomerase C-terminal repeat-containing protein, partial [Microbacteriaceae bacterium]|nr:topoisomerase C-terminal repeat-containing protein [Microbacteriaceae bacterium]
EGAEIAVAAIEPKGHETTPPPRYTEASLVKRLEELGIGRPSTFASIISTILDRGYVSLRGQALIPSWTAFSVVKLLEEHFGDLVSYDFTAEMENDLDRIASGEANRVDWLTSFYFGGGDQPGLRTVVDNLGEIDARAINSVAIADGITLRIGKYGPYLELPPEEEGGDPIRVNVPEDIAPDELTIAKAHELIDKAAAGDRVVGVHPVTGQTIVAKDGRYGPYITELIEDEVDPVTGEVLPPKKNAPKPRTASLFKSMSPATVDLDTAVRLLDLPRVVGVDPESGDEIKSQNGRYGPYLTKGTDTRSLPSEDAIFDIDLAGALDLFAQPKYGARRASAAIKEFDADPVSGKPIKIKDGRFGPYVTDGETNATVPRGEEPTEITFERAVELLQIKRDKGPAPKRGAKKTPAKKATTKKAPAKKTASKSATKAPKSSS